MTLPITWAANTDIGRVRRENQDRWLARQDDGLFAVADGMGGLPGGAQAATAALAALSDEFTRTRPVTAAAWEALVHEVNEKVRRIGMTISPVEGIGSTLTLLHLEEGGAKLVHVGDSACFLLRAGKLSQLTEDHTVAAEAERRLARGLSANPQPWAEHILTRCIGQPQLDGVDISAVAMQAGDRFLVCTDGVTKVLDHESIAQCLGSAITPTDALARLISSTLDAGAPDNVTGIAIFAREA